MLQQQQNLWRRVGTSKMNLSRPVALAAVRSKAVVLLLLIHLLLLLLSDSLDILCFAVRYFVSILVLQSSRWGRESCFVFLVPRDCYVSLPHDATGLSAVCGCGIS